MLPYLPYWLSNFYILIPLHYSSIIEVGIGIFAAALSALRPFLKQLPCFRNIGSGGSGKENGKPHALALTPLRTFGQGLSRTRGHSYRLDDEISITSRLDS